MVTMKAYAPVRRTDGKEWISTGEVAPLPEMARAAAAESDRKCGASWVRANPVVRFVVLSVSEAETLEVVR